MACPEICDILALKNAIPYVPRKTSQEQAARWL